MFHAVHKNPTSRNKLLDHSSHTPVLCRMNEMSGCPVFLLPVLDQSGVREAESHTVGTLQPALLRSHLTSSPFFPLWLSVGCSLISLYPPAFISVQISLLLPCLSSSISSYYLFLSHFLLPPLSSHSSSFLPLPSPCMERQLTASLLSSTVPLFSLSLSSLLVAV